MAKDLKSGENLRWVRNSERNREVLFDFIIRRILIYKLLRSANWRYLPCCCVFSRQKPTGEGHKDTKINPLDFLLEEDEKNKALDFKSKLKKKYSSHPQKKDLAKVAKAEVFSFFKTELKLGKLTKLIEDLPRKDGCFYLPLCKEKYTDDCPGCSLFLNPGAPPLKFKVDLFSKPQNQQHASKIKNQQEKEGSELVNPTERHQPGIIGGNGPSPSSNIGPYLQSLQPTRLGLDTTTPSQNSSDDTKIILNQILQKLDYVVSKIDGDQRVQRNHMGFEQNPQDQFYNPVEEEAFLEAEVISAGSQDPKMIELEKSLINNSKTFQYLSEEEMNEQISQFTILKHHKERLVRKHNQEQNSLKQNFSKVSLEIARIEEEVEMAKTNL